MALIFQNSRRGADARERKKPKKKYLIALDIFGVISAQYGIPLEKLANAYLNGALDAVEERKAK